MPSCSPNNNEDFSVENWSEDIFATSRTSADRRRCTTTTDNNDSGATTTTPDLYKTELCRSFEETGSCRYGIRCQFAHGKAELKPVGRHPRYKTKLCRTFHTRGFCAYGSRCHFIHNVQEVQKRTAVVVKQVRISKVSVKFYC